MIFCFELEQKLDNTNFPGVSPDVGQLWNFHLLSSLKKIQFEGNELITDFIESTLWNMRHAVKNENRATPLNFS